MEISDELVDGKNVLLIWNENCYPGEMKQVVESLRSKTGVTGNISLEHAERLIMGTISSTNITYNWSANILERLPHVQITTEYLSLGWC